jgi:putative membrane protein
MKKVLMFGVALMFPAFALALSDDKGELNDGQIAHVVVTANQGDIENGELAKKKASNKQVRAFANRMIKEHSSLNKEAKELIIKLKMATEDNPISKDLKVDIKNNLDQLKNLNGREFDNAYIDREIEFHQKIIDVADSKLAPNVKNVEIKALLTKTRPALAAHLEQAKIIQGSINGQALTKPK